MATKAILARTTKGVLSGGLLTAAIAVGFVFFVILARSTSDDDPDTQQGEKQRLVLDLLLAFVDGSFVGGIAGAAARLPEKGVSLAKSIAIVAGFALVARLATILVLGFQKFGYPYAPTFIAAVLGSTVVLIYGLLRSKAGTG